MGDFGDENLKQYFIRWKSQGYALFYETLCTTARPRKSLNITREDIHAIKYWRSDAQINSSNGTLAAYLGSCRIVLNQAEIGLCVHEIFDFLRLHTAFSPLFQHRNYPHCPNEI